MLTNNGVRLFKNLLAGFYADGNHTASYMQTDGKTYGLMNSQHLSPKTITATEGDGGLYGSNLDATFICVGSSDSPPVRNSINLVNMYTSQLQRSGGTASIEVNANMDVAFYSVTNSFTNVSDSSLTIREIGCFALHGYSNVHQRFLLDRKVLENPVTLGPGESIAFTYSFNL